ncbi:N5-carboxyaminoimidazole ribonucleotide mutase [Hondaea fermentalgiana]|uniref:phosphoribosylaminoimidazole carboxylase n=1 Tax=Hondaea fermentalgiana TaxID=2315210 RepID=A0A2R5G9M2_9STRA|nr:N5-carboxyaminoimidazole ribonucleotide mutase [Hondaea fermentalgiana]|eukprot:GBG27737.1 N5-carboxyaminoimidazole ribonucleotide mutase [Hondaea fermentalgiana]
MSTAREGLRRVLAAVAAGEVSVARAEAEISASLANDAVRNFAKLDAAREVRTGFPEVVFGQGKRPEHVVSIFARAQERGMALFGTRISPEVADLVSAEVSGITYYPEARIAAVHATPSVPDDDCFDVSVLTGGTADLEVAEEAAVTLELNHIAPRRVYDVGVAGIDRLLKQTDVLRKSKVIIAVAGMEGALPSVVAGLVDCPVLAVPTSVGYGASFQGLVPLLAMLNGCAPGVSVVNIDNGFGAAAMAKKILETAKR